MNANVKIGEQVVPMVSVASVDIIYKQVFGVDPIALQTGDMDEGDAITLFMQMGYIMANMAKGETRGTKDGYIEWLGQFDRKSFYDALPDIRAAYEGQDLALSEAKKNNDQPSDA